MALAKYRGASYEGWVDPDFQLPEWLLEQPDRLHEVAGSECLLECAGRRIYRLPLQLDGRLETFFGYYFRNSSLGRSLRCNYAFRSLKRSRELKAHGFATLEVMLALKRRTDWFNWHSFLLAREIRAVYEIPSEGPHVFRTHPIIEFTPELASALARELSRLHRHGFFHGDLKTRHILVRTVPNPGTRFYFVDLEKCLHLPRLPAPIGDVLMVRDLVQFFASLPPRYGELRPHFLNEYLSGLEIDEGRRRRIRKLLSLYHSDRFLKQGETLLSGVRRLLLRR